MGSLQSLTYINELMSRFNLSFKKSLGQNFLIDKNALDRIILEADLKTEDVVLEIGPGIGTLTRALAKKSKEVYAVEIDQRLIPVLEETLEGYSNINVINNDILELDLSFLHNKQLRIVANLPYYITTPIIYHLLEQRLNIEKMVFLVQKEVAQRFVADLGTKHYGTTSVTLQAFADVKLAFIVKPVCFIPQPNVESAVISIKPKPNIDYDVDLLQRVVKKAFLQRRKKIINALSAKGDLEYSKEQWKQILANSAIVEDKRPDSISVEEYLRIVLNTKLLE